MQAENASLHEPMLQRFAVQNENGSQWKGEKQETLHGASK